ncbi:MAG: alpha/beta fold hydrolase [Dehalococcoidia bacterium]
MVTVRETAAFLKLDAGRMHYRKLGTGWPLFLLHSLGTSSLAWQKATQPLAQKFTVYAWDMMGHGDSDKPQHDYSLEEYGDRMAEAAKALSLERVAFMGNSIGAVIALDVAARYPDLVTKLVLVGCPCWPDAKAREEALAASAAAYDADGNPKPMTLEGLAGSFAKPTQELVEFMNGQRQKAGVWAYRSRLAVGRYDVPAKLSSVRCPTLVVYGDKDQLRSSEELLRRGVRGAQSALLTNAGHLPQLEAPPAFADAVLPFLTAP